MKASPVMAFAYVSIIGVPILMIALAVAAILGSALFAGILLGLIAVGCSLYGLIGIREVFVHGTHPREKQT